MLHEHKGGEHTLAALKSIRAARPDGAPIYIVCDNLSGNTTPAIRTWAAAHKVELCLTPTNASWADPIEAQFGPCARSRWPTPTTPTTPCWPADCTPTCAGATPTPATRGVLDAQRRERARVRSEKGHRWGRPQPRAA